MAMATLDVMSTAPGPLSVNVDELMSNANESRAGQLVARIARLTATLPRVRVNEDPLILPG